MKCKTPYCRNQARKQRTICCTCKDKQYIKRNPIKASYNRLKQNAKRRNKIFNITFEYFKQFCYEVDLLTQKGKRKKSYTVDCIINALGYIEGNLQKLTRSENASKSDKVLVYDYQTKVGYYIKQKEINSTPF